MSESDIAKDEQNYFNAYTHVRRSINTVWKIISEEMEPFKINVMARRTPKFVLNKIKDAYRNSIEFSFDVGLPRFEKHYLIVFHTEEVKFSQEFGNKDSVIKEDACSILTIQRFTPDEENVHFEKETYFTDSDSEQPHHIVIGLIAKAKSDMAFQRLHRNVYECLVMRNDYRLLDVKKDEEPFF